MVAYLYAEEMNTNRPFEMIFKKALTTRPSLNRVYEGLNIFKTGLYLKVVQQSL